MAEAQDKPVMLVGIDDSEQSFYSLEWALEKFFTPFSPNYPFKIILIHAKPFPASVIGLAGPGAANAVLYANAEANQKRIAALVLEKAKEMCVSKGINDVAVDVVEGDARNVLSEAVDQHNASMLVVGSHGYGAIKRAVLGSVSDYCAHHAHCSVLIVKKPKAKK